MKSEHFFSFVLVKKCLDGEFRVGSYCTLEHVFSFQHRYLLSIVRENSGYLTVENVSLKIVQGLLDLDGRNSQKYLHQT